MAAQRECAGCDVVDDHPRLHHVQAGSPDRLWHYDCAPRYVREEHPEVADVYKAAAAGKRGEQLVAVVHKVNDKLAKENS